MYSISKYGHDRSKLNVLYVVVCLRDSDDVFYNLNLDVGSNVDQLDLHAYIEQSKHWYS